GHLHPPHVVRQVGEHRLHLVEVAHADPTTGDEGVAHARRTGDGVRHRFLVIAYESEVDHLASVGRDQSPQRMTVGVTELTRTQWRRPFHQLVAGGQHTHADSTHDSHGRHSHAGQHAEVHGSEDRPCFDDDVSLTDVVAGLAH